MRRSTGISIYAYWCSQPAVAAEHFHLASIRLLQELGCTFLEVAPHPAPPHPNPECEISPEGRLLGSLEFLHRILAAPEDCDEEAAFVGRYRSLFDKHSFVVWSGFLKTDMPSFELLENSLTFGRHELLSFLLPYYLPRLAFVDSIWDDGIKERHLENCELRRLFWTTYFGKKYVEKHGRQFFLDTPAWKVEEIADGILITVTEKYLDFSRNEPKETLKHLRQKFKGIRPNRYKEDPNF